VQRIDVESAEQMFEIVKENFTDTNIAILSAAVADYSPLEKQEGKIKKAETGEQMNLNLKSTPDILKYLGQNKKSNQLLIGFALESTNEINNGWKKLQDKNCDMIVVNSANKPKSGFGGDDNTITILMRNGNHYSYDAMSKKRCAMEILLKIKDL
jgi:phosphopantothenoylcysteine decarboxylase/phosphopantothenate--cysteine ligase